MSELMMYKLFYCAMAISHTIGMLTDDNYRESFISFVNLIIIFVAIIIQLCF